MNLRLLTTLAAAQFLMVLDQAVMNVSISQLVEDFDTTVTTIQAIIAFYALVMAGLMLIGGKLGDIYGRKRIFKIGLVIYACGSALTAASWSVASLALGWSVLEGIGAAMVMPAMVALVAGNFEGKNRAIAYGVLGGMAGVGIAVGPILGGWMTTDFTWRYVFLGEVALAAAIFIGTRWMLEPPALGRRPRLDVVGGVLSALGLAVMVMGVLQASNWGWLRPMNSPVVIFGFSLTPFVIVAGLILLGLFASWERRREERGEDPLVHLALFRNVPLRSGLSMMLAQNLILMGIFFTIPLYLQVVLGFDALDTGVRMLPTSAGLFFTALAGSALASRFAPKKLVRLGLVVVFVSALLLVGTIEPSLDNTDFLVAMGVLGVGMGLIVSQLGNVAQSAVGDEDRSEAGGLQYTAQQLGSSLGTAILGAILITGLLTAFSSNVGNHGDISEQTKSTVEQRLSSGGSFVSSETVRQAGVDAGLPETEVNAIVESYQDAQLQSLKLALLFAALLVIPSFWSARNLPDRVLGEPEAADDGEPAAVT
ncbi:MAG: MFS transporter [Solirubrobacterales bacterium]|nr:MFS transporter [Solirubrobacterales bacterium]